MAYQFNDDDAQTGSWFKFTNVGDSIQGTLISKRVVPNKLPNAQQENQTVYELKKEDGEIWNVGSKPAIDEKMRNIKLGQIVEFRLLEIKKPSRPGLSGAKIIQVYANPNIVDKEWLLEQETANQLAPVDDGGIKVTNIEPITGDSTPADLESKILNIGMVKFGATDPAEIKEAIMTNTGLAYIPSNYAKILEALQSM